MTYKITVTGCLLPCLNGTYTPTTENSKLPHVCINVQTNSKIQPFLIYHKEALVKSKLHRYAIFVVPCIPQLFVSKPCWVIAELPFAKNNNNNNNNNRNSSKESDPIYYYYQQIDMSNKYATRDVYNPKILGMNSTDYPWKCIAGLLTSPISSIRMEIGNLHENETIDHDNLISGINGKNNNDNNNNNNNNNSVLMLNRANSASSSSSDLVPIDETKEVTLTNDENLSKFTENSGKGKNDKKWHYFDVEDKKCDSIECVGSNQIIRVTDDISELEREWEVSELGTHDELECFLGCVGKVIDISDDGDDTIKVQWSNMDMSWLPFRACWITWNKNWDNYPLTMPKYYYSDIEQSTSEAGSSISNEDQFTMGSPLASAQSTAGASSGVSDTLSNNKLNDDNDCGDKNNKKNKNEKRKRGSSQRSEKANDRLDRQSDLNLVSDIV